MVSELRQAIRTLLKSPGFTVSAILILGLGCAASTSIFSVAYSVIIRDLPYPAPDRLVSLSTRLPRAIAAKAPAGASDYFDWRRRQQVFTDLALTRIVANFNLTGEGEPERIRGTRTTASLFHTLGVAPIIGRTFTEAEQLDPERAAAVAVLSYSLWQRRFAGDPDILNRKIRLNGRDTEVIGVMPREFHYPDRDYDLWDPLYYPAEELRDRLDFSYLSVARLRPGISIEQARAQMNAIAANLAREYPRTNRDLGVSVEPLLGAMTESVRPAIWLLFAAVGTLFLVGCVNLANLLLARAAGRQAEFTIRAALGATRMRLIRQSLVETVPLAIAGSGLGIWGADFLLKVLVPLLPPGLPRIEEIGIHLPVLLFTIALSVAAAFAVSIAPALHVSANLQRGPESHSRLRDLLICAEIAFTVVLLVSAGLLMRSFVNVRATDPGFQADHVLGLHFAVDRATHGDTDSEVWRYLSRLIDRVQSIPGVQTAGVVNRLPLGGQTQTLQIEFEGRGVTANIDSRSASPDYFRALGIPLLAGRAFRNDDIAGHPDVGILDEQIARQVFGDQSPIGKRFRIAIVPGMPWVQIVGVAGHVRHEGLDRDPRPQVYWPYAQRTQDRVAMAIRTAGSPRVMTSAIRAAIREIDPNQPLYDVFPMSDFIARTLLTQRLNLILVGSFAALALLLASIGLYGVVSHLTARRSREFGVRLAVGATPAHLLSTVFRESLTRASVGLATGLLLAGIITQLLSSMIYGVTTLDPLTYVAVAALLMIVVVAASYVPARRASRTDPLSALRDF
ncbi:MAG TPA: ABC transporter permease [Bryobacteraceae bacterium]|nr:ABC transporter permease [Bryobacteraceae bacterium]